MYYNQYPDEAGNSPLEAEDTKLKRMMKTFTHLFFY